MPSVWDVSINFYPIAAVHRKQMSFKWHIVCVVAIFTAANKLFIFIECTEITRRPRPAFEIALKKQLLYLNKMSYEILSLYNQQVLNMNNLKGFLSPN